MDSNGFLQSVLGHIDDFSRDGQLAGELLEHKPDFSTGRPEHFYLKDLINPQASYWEHIDEAPELSDRQKEIFEHGNRMEARARRAFSNLGDFSEAESTLDGAENEIPGVRGKVDFRYADSLVEFKTSEFQIDTGQDVWNKAPQDIEQLLFYTVLWTHDNDVHYLIYHSEEDPRSLRAFEVRINEPDVVRRILESRKSRLRQAIEEQNPTTLGRCRFYGHTCQIGEAGLCDCSNLEELDSAPLRDVTDVTRDRDFEDRLIIALRASDGLSSIGAWDLYTPTQWFAREFHGQERGGDYITPDWVYHALSAADLTPGPFAQIESPELGDVVEFDPRVTFIKRTRTVGQESETYWVPARITAKTWRSPPSRDKAKYQFMQTACVAAAMEKNRAILIIELPESGAEVDVHELQLTDVGGLREKVRNRVNLINQAVADENPDGLPECPEDWMQNDCENCLCQ